MLVGPVWAHKEVHVHLSLVDKLYRMLCYAGAVVVTTAQPAAKEGVQLLNPRLKSISLPKYGMAIYVYIIAIDNVIHACACIEYL